MDTYLDYARRGLTAWWRYLLAIVLALVIWIALDVAIVVGLFATHLMPRDVAGELTKPSHPVLFFGANGLAFATIVLGLVIAMRLIQRKRFVDVIGQWRWRLFATGLGIWTVCLVGTTLVDFLLRPSGFHWSATPATPSLVVAALIGLGAQTFTEEFVFRGYLTQGLLLATKRPLVTALISGAIFASLHIPNGWPQAAGALVFGIVTAMIAMRTGGLGFGWGMHVANNLFGAILIVSTDDVLRGSPGVFTVAAPDLAWLDVAVSVVAFALVWVFVNRRWPAAAQPAQIA